MGQLWNGNGSHGNHRIQAMQGMDEHFKEYRLGTVTKELSRIESLL